MSVLRLITNNTNSNDPDAGFTYNNPGAPVFLVLEGMVLAEDTTMEAMSLAKKQVLELGSAVTFKL